jgi:flagellar hook-associated protein 1 FlgK
MSGMLSIGSSALMAYQTALDVVSQNIANANTPGYVRQAVNLQNIGSAALPSSAGGDGVEVQSVQNLSDQFVQQQLVSDSSSYNYINTFQTYSSQVDSALSSSSTGLSTPLQNFFTAVNSLSSTPTSSATRQALLSSAQTLSSTFNSLQQQLASVGSQIAGGVSSTVSQINGYATQLAQLNVSIAQATAQGNGQPPNNLLDQRNELLQNMAGDIGISTTTNADGSVNVYVANGQALVLDGSANSLSVQPGAFGQSQDIVLNSGSNASVIASQVSGGTLGGMLNAQSQVIEPAMNQLGQLAVTLADAVNSQNAQGMNQYGQLGGNIFTAPTVSVTAAGGNSGSATVSASIADSSQLGAANYLLQYNGSSWNLLNQSSGASVALSGSGTTASPLSGAGMQIVIGGTPAAGDQFLVQPTQFAAAALSTAITDPALIAAAAPVQTAAGTANTGSATIGAATVSDAGNPNLLSTSTIQFTSPTSYSINGAGSYSYSSGGNISVNGVQVQISGIPAAGDSFTISANSGSSSDNSNAELMADIANQTLMNGGLNTLNSANAAMVSQFGAQAQQAQQQLGAETAIRNQDQSQFASVSGVNLDEEAASMMQFQQAYQAAAQIIATSDTLFQSLVSALQAG